MKNKFKELIVKIFKSKTGRIIISSIVVCIVIAIVILFSYNREEELDTTYIIARLEEASELTTAKLTYTGMSKFEDSGVVIINKANFIMVYKATARAGIDVKEIKVDPDNTSKIVWLTIPKAKIIEVKVDTDSIEYFDEKLALFNLNSKEDANKAVAIAEEKAKEELANMGILEMADAQAAALVKGLIQDVVPKDYVIKIKE